MERVYQRCGDSGPFVELPALVAAGQFFQTATGDPFTVIEASEFNLLNRSEAGEDVEPVFRQMAEYGFNVARVWTAYDIPKIGRLIPRERPGLYAHISVLIQKAAQHGVYIEFTAFTGPYTGIFANDLEKIAHWDQIKTATAGLSCLLELVNEGDNAPNRDLPWPQLFDSPDNECSHGSGTMDATPVQPYWDHATWHGPAFEWQRKIGHNAMELSSTLPIFTNEIPRYPDNESSLEHAEDGAEGAALLCAGSCYHTVSGKLGLPWEAGVEADGAKAFADGARRVPLEFQRGRYVHRTDLESDEIIRAYSRVLRDGREYVVRIRA